MAEVGLIQCRVPRAGAPSRPAASPPPCACCSARNSRPLWPRRAGTGRLTLPLHRCRTCGLVFAWPQPAAEEIRGFYDADYYVFHEPPAKRWGRAAQLYIEYLLPLESLPGSRRLLEVGCARGELLVLARRRGWSVVGVELSPQAARAARQDWDLDVRAGTIEQHAADLPPCDLAVATDVIEHVPEPRRFLRSMAATLGPGGLILLETPNWDGLWRRLGGHRWIGLNPFHIFLFGPRSLGALARSCGLEPLDMRGVTNFAHALWGSRPELDAAVRHLPEAVAWRIRAGLDRLTPPSRARSLCLKPPDSCDAALASIEAAAGNAAARPNAGRFRRLRACLGDNLAMLARPCDR